MPEVTLKTDLENKGKGAIYVVILQTSFFVALLKRVVTPLKRKLGHSKG